MNTTTLKIAIEVDDKGSVKIRQVGDAAEVAGRKGAGGFNAMDSSMAKADRTASLLSTTIRGMGAAIVAGVTIDAVQRTISLADAYTRADGRLRLVTGSAVELAAVQDELYAIAQRTRTETLANVEAYSRFAQNTKELHLSQSNLLTITETLNKAFIISGATEAERAATMVQLSQALSAGVLRGEEFNSVAEQGSRVMQLLADHTGKTRGELRAMAEDGQITATVLVDAILAGAADVNTEFGKMPMTVGQAGAMLANTLGDLVSDANRATGATQGIAEAIAGIARTIDENKEGILSFFAAFSAAAAGAASGAEMMAQAGMASIDSTLRSTASAVPGIKAQITELQAEIDRVNNAPGLKAIKTEDGSLAAMTYELEREKAALKELVSSPYVTGAAAGKLDIVAAAWKENATQAGFTAAMLGKVGTVSDEAHKKTLDYIKTREQAAREDRDQALRGAKTAEEMAAVQAKYKEQLDKITGAAKGRKKATDEAARDEKEQARAMEQTLGRLLPLREAEQERAESLEHLRIALGAGAITEDEYRQGLSALNREMAEAQERAGSYAREIDAAARAAKESDLTRQGIAIETAIAAGQLSASDALPFQVDLLRQRLVLQEEHLASLKKNTPAEITAWNSQAEAVARTNLELVGLHQRLRLRDPWEAARQGLKDFADQAVESGETIRAAVEGAFSSMTTTLAEFVATGKWEFGSLVDSIIRDLARISIQQTITAPLASALGGLLGGFGRTVSSGSTVSGNFSADAVYGGVGIYHDGGIVGLEGGMRAGVNPATFDTARRYHSGLLPGEFPAILQRGEGVFTEQQMVALGAAASGGANVVINVIEGPGKGGTQQQRDEGGSRVIDVFVERVKAEVAADIVRGRGQLPRALQSTYGLNRAMGAR